MQPSVQVGAITRAIVLLTTLELCQAALAGGAPTLPDWTSVAFRSDSAVSDNPYFPLVPGFFSVYEGIVEGGAVERIETFVTFDTKMILGVKNRIVRDTSYLDGVVKEIALDWYAQSDDGTVWYFGEFVKNFHYNESGELIDIDNTGSWIADGVTNLPGAVMLSKPEVGDIYFQEYAPSVALDFALVQSLDESVTVPFGTFESVLETSEGNLFDGPQLTDDKLYAPDVGLVLINVLDERGRDEFAIGLVDQTPPLATLDDWTAMSFGPSSALSENPLLPIDPGTFKVFEGTIEGGVRERLETFVTFETKIILGVEARVVRDQTFKDGRLVETALDWYAQANDGSVWYFGEFVENYHYNESGALVSTDNLGSWIADGKETLPGIVMRADPKIGDAYFQEFAPGVAFDFAIVTDDGATLSTPVGTFADALVTAEGNYFDGPGLAENKIYDDDIGLIGIQVLDDEGRPAFFIQLIEIDMASCLGDIDHNNHVDAGDLAALLGAWGEDDAFADLNGDGVIDGADLAALLAAWGPCN